MGSPTNASAEAGKKPGATTRESKDAQEVGHDVIGEWLQKAGDVLGWLRDVIVNYAQVLGMILFVFAGLYSGFMLLHAMLGNFGAAGTLLCLLVGGGGVALFAYLEHVDDLEEAEIDREVEEEYEAIKEEERRLVKEVLQEGEKREQESRLTKAEFLLAEYGDELDLPPVLSEEDLEAMFLEADDAAENAVDKLASIQKLRGLRDRLMKLSTQSAEEAVSRQAKVLEKLSLASPDELNLSEINKELNKVAKDSVSEMPSMGEVHGDGSDQDATLRDTGVEALLRHETLRRRVANNAAASSVSTERAD